MLNRLPASSWRPWRVLAASLLFVNFLLAMGLMNSLLEDNSPSNTVPTSVSDVPGALTIGMLVRNRPDYLVTMPLFMQKLTPGVDHAIVIDMGSNPPLAPLNTTATQPKVRALANCIVVLIFCIVLQVDFKLLRVESDAFQMNRALALLLEHTQSETVLLMDNDCYPVGIDLKQRSVRLMYPTVYRFFMTNVMVPRSALVAFVNILPLRLLDDSKSFEGLDQIWAWYFGLEMAPLGLVRVRPFTVVFPQLLTLVSLACRRSRDRRHAAAGPRQDVCGRSCIHMADFLVAEPLWRAAPDAGCDRVHAHTAAVQRDAAFHAARSACLPRSRYAFFHKDFVVGTARVAVLYHDDVANGAGRVGVFLCVPASRAGPLHWPAGLVHWAQDDRRHDMRPSHGSLGRRLIGDAAGTSLVSFRVIPYSYKC